MTSHFYHIKSAVQLRIISKLVEKGKRKWYKKGKRKAGERMEEMEYRRQGIAKYMCVVAMKEVFDYGAKMISLRAVEPGTRELYTSLGYNLTKSL